MLALEILSIFDRVISLSAVLAEDAEGGTAA